MKHVETEAVVFIPPTQGKVTVIDFEDFDERVRSYKWCTFKMGRRFYAGRRGPRPERYGIYLHRVLMEANSKPVDHKDGDGLNNRRSNLRIVTVKENNQAFKRKQHNTSSKFRGVSKFRKKWKAGIQGEYLGVYNTEMEAAKAFDRAAGKRGFPREAFNFLVLFFLFLCLVPSSLADTASWYGDEHRGKLMANGKLFNPDNLTAASWQFPLGTRVLVRSGNKEIVVTITDRGPAKRLVAQGRIIDLSAAAFKKLADPRKGLIEITVQKLP